MSCKHEFERTAEGTGYCGICGDWVVLSSISEPETYYGMRVVEDSSVPDSYGGIVLSPGVFEAWLSEE